MSVDPKMRRLTTWMAKLDSLNRSQIALELIELEDEVQRLYDDLEPLLERIRELEKALESSECK